MKPFHEYVLGFMFNAEGSCVVLIRKIKTNFNHQGKLNGVGGMIENNETPLAAMVREFEEETGEYTAQEDWECFGELSGDTFRVFLFKGFDQEAFDGARTTTNEVIEKWNHDDLVDTAHVSNLPWLINMALDKNEGKKFYATVRYDTSL